MQILISLSHRRRIKPTQGPRLVLDHPGDEKKGTPEKQNLSRSKGFGCAMTAFGNIVDGVPCSSRWGSSSQALGIEECPALG